MKKKILFLILFTLIFTIGAKFPFEETPVLTPAQEQKTFVLEKGLKILLVASEPMVQDPVAISFDEDGRMWVVEMRGYMPDVEATNEKDSIGRISVLEDLNGDGLMDKSTVYLDSLVLPRAMAIVKGGILYADHQSLWQSFDTNGDLKSDTKILIDKNYAGSTAPEHSANGLLRNLDNWYYNAKSRFRYKKIEGKWVKDSTEFRGQWGMSQDDKGRLHYNYNWSQLHADMVPPNTLSRNKNHTPTSGIDHGLTIDRHVYPIRETPAVNRAYIPGTLSKDNRLKEFSAACSPLVYRETLLPKTYFGNVFVCEPVGNLIKRNVIKEMPFFNTIPKNNTLSNNKNSIELVASDPHPGTEFLASTDERFRPTNLASGPDGAIYIADMYKGIIQHVLYQTPYLKDQHLKRGLDKHLHKGRIWRIVPENWQPKKLEKQSALTSKQLVANLSSSDGWQRDMAQRLLIEKEDKSIESDLIKLSNSTHTLGRMHALWTMEGLNLIKPNLLVDLISDKNVLISNTAMRIYENLDQKDKFLTQKLNTILPKIALNAPIDQALQIAISSQMLDKQIKFSLLSDILNKYGKSTIIKDAVMSSLQNDEFELLKYLNKSPNWLRQNPDKEIFIEMLTTAIIKNNNPMEINGLLSKVNLKPNNWQEKSILMGLIIQSGNSSNPIKLETEPKLLAENNKNIEEYNRQKLKLMFEWPGYIPYKNVAKDQIVLKPDEQKMFSKGRIQYLNTCAGCHGSDGKGVPRFAPKLADSEWVIGNETRLALIVLHGIEGAIIVDGKKYDQPEILPVMPAHSTVDDATITNILTYIRNEWGNNAGPISRMLVGRTRHTTQGRVLPWKVDDLNKHVESLGSDK